jgi:hypothetical protein|tara:strand:- start:298 stop:474 length:177 start_codon:yes stop_codon:yes gene_type:complete
MKCNKDGCKKDAMYIVDGQSLCNDHTEGTKVEQKQDPQQEPTEPQGQTAGDKLAGSFK